MLVDLHTHIQFNIFKDDADKVINRAKEAGVFMVAPSTKLSTSRAAIEIAKKYPKRVFAAVGLHPLYTKPLSYYDPDEDINPNAEEIMQDFNINIDRWHPLAVDPSVVAIGEIGLDYIERLEVSGKDRELQEEILREQIALALIVDKPVILHCRDGVVDGIKKNAHDDMISILKEYAPRGLKGVSHCFSGNEMQAQEYIKLGFGLSFTGLITYNGAWDKIIKESPLENIFTETDSPYLTPVPHRGERNEPVNVRYVAEHIAKIKEISFEQVAEKTSQSAKQLFNLRI